MSLFDTIDKIKEEIWYSVDKINMLMGKDKIRLASQGFERRWKLRQEKLSLLHYTIYRYFNRYLK